MRTILPLLFVLLVSLALQSDAASKEKSPTSSAEIATRTAITVPMRKRPQFRRRLPPPSKKSSVPASRAILARRGPAPPAVPSKSAEMESADRAAPGIVPPKGIASQLNQAKFHEFMSLARSLMKSRRALA